MLLLLLLLLLLLSCQVCVLLQRAAASPPGAPNPDRSATTQHTAGNLLAACVFVFDKVHQQQHQQQHQLLLQFPRNFYGTHKHREFAQRVVVHAVIPAASRPLLGARSARQRHPHSPPSSPVIVLPRHRHSPDALPEATLPQ